MQNEIFFPVIGYEGLYIVSNTGSVVSLLSGKQLAEQDVDGYSRVTLSINKNRKGYLVHRIVFCSFNGIPLYFVGHKKFVVMHIDDNRKNNRLENLKGGTQKENVHDMMLKGRAKHACNTFKNFKNTRLSQDDIRKIFRLSENGIPRKYIAEKFGVDRGKITRILQGKLYATAMI